MPDSEDEYGYDDEDEEFAEERSPDPFQGKVWSERDDGETDEDMSPLEQLMRYQFVIRKICPYLDPYEIAALMQIVDRVTGWRRHQTYFGNDKLHSGDQMWGGLSRTMHWTRMMKALRSLEDRGVISRIRQKYYDTRIFRVNYNLDLEKLTASAPEPRRERNRDRGKNQPAKGEFPVSEEDRWVRVGDLVVSNGDHTVSLEDRTETYPDNGTYEWHSDRSAQLSSESRATRLADNVTGQNEGRTAQAQPGQRDAGDPPPRIRRRRDP